jgi:hypothetical protein
MVFTAIGALSACSGDTSTGPAVLRQTDMGASAKSGQAASDSSTELVATFALQGRVRGVSAKSGQYGGDTLSYEPIAGAAVRIYRNLLVDGAATQVLAAQTTSDAAGQYRVEGLEGGYYIVKAVAPAGSPYADSWTYAAGTAPEVTADVYLWRQP